MLALTAGLCSCGESSKYEQAQEMMQSGDYEGAKAILLEISEYEDSESLINECEEQIQLQNLYGKWECDEMDTWLRFYKENKEKKFQWSFTWYSGLLGEGSFEFKNGQITTDSIYYAFLNSDGTLEFGDTESNGTRTYKKVS